MNVEKVDFLSVHTTDVERSRLFYVELPGLPVEVDRESATPVSATWRSSTTPTGTP
jgi:hypothetical protein